MAGFSNLHCMEVDAKRAMEEHAAAMGAAAPGGIPAGIAPLVSDLLEGIPGIDEAVAFAQMMRHVQSLDFDVIVFDTAPTGHTLRLLSFPAILDKALAKLGVLKGSLSGVMNMLGAGAGAEVCEGRGGGSPPLGLLGGDSHPLRSRLRAPD